MNIFVSCEKLGEVYRKIIDFYSNEREYLVG